MSLPTGTNYPGAIDGVSNGYSAVSAGQTVTSAYANDLASAILALETVVGASPLTGTSYSTIGDALAGLVDTLVSSGLAYTVDDGTADAYALVLTPTPTSYTTGQVVLFKAMHANTGSATLALNSLSPQPLVKAGGAALAQGDIVAGQVVLAFYDGTQFQMMGTITPSNIQTGSLVYATDLGTANAYAVTLSPTPPPYAAGQMVVFVAANTNTEASTLAVNGQSAQALVQNGGTAVAPGSIAAGQAVVAVYDGTQFQMVGSSTAITGAPSTNDFRLTLWSGSPVTVDLTQSVTGGTTIYLTPYKGNRIGLYSGAWSILTSAEVSISTSALSNGTIYDIFAYNSSGTVTLEFGTPWADANDRAVALSQQDGVWVSSADSTRRYVGTIFTDSGSGVSDVSYTRSLWNADNRVARQISITQNGGAGVTTTNSNSWTSLLYGPEFVIGMVLDSVSFTGGCKCEGDSGNTTAAEIAINGVGTAAVGIGACQDTQYLTCSTIGQPALGLNYPELDLRASIDGFTVQSIDDTTAGDSVGAIWWTGTVSA